MTNNEAINILLIHSAHWTRLIEEKICGMKEGKEAVKAIDLAIEALEQEPCEDAVSRQAAIDLADELKDDLPDDEGLWDMVMAHNEGILEYQTNLSLLPYVRQKQRTGRWIDDKCSVCGKEIEDLISSREWYRNEKPKFCPFCGVKLVDSQESEDKE